MSDKAHQHATTSREPDHTHQTNVARLQQDDQFYAPVHEEVVRWLAIVPGSAILDVGCGTGALTLLLAAGVPDGTVAAVDPSADAVAMTRSAAAAAGMAERVTVSEGGLEDLPFSDGRFDMVWCSRVVHGRPDQVAAVRELRRVLKPGGRLVLREGGLPPRILPQDTGLAEPGLEDRLEALYRRWFAGWRAAMPGAVAYPAGWLQLLRDAGFAGVAAKSFLLERTAPFEDAIGAYLVQQLRGRLEHPQIGGWLDPRDREALAQLTDPESPAYLLRRTDLHVLAVVSLYIGRR